MVGLDFKDYFKDYWNPCDKDPCILQQKVSNFRWRQLTYIAYMSGSHHYVNHLYQQADTLPLPRSTQLLREVSYHGPGNYAKTLSDVYLIRAFVMLVTPLSDTFYVSPWEYIFF